MADLPNSGPACCILGLSCCPPGGLTPTGARKLHLVRKLQNLCSSLTDREASEIADGLLAEFDLVPAGVGIAIANAYDPWIKRAPDGTSIDDDKPDPDARR